MRKAQNKKSFRRNLNPKRKAYPMKKDIYQTITNRIIADLEKGVRPWMKPWSVENASGRISLPLRANGVPYRGINILMLWSQAIERGYSSPHWMTFKQAKELGAFVKKGEQAAHVVYASTLSRTETDEHTGEESERNIPFLKSYAVFNAEQVEGLPERFTQQPEKTLEPVQRIERVEAFIRSTGAEVRHGGGKAYYHVVDDRVQMPLFETFDAPESYYATLAHELTHWTRHKSRLNREFGRKRWGDEGYATEELVAELGSAFLGADLELTPEVREDHAAYIANWLTVLKNDKRAIFTAAGHAQRAADFLMAFGASAEQEAA